MAKRVIFLVLLAAGLFYVTFGYKMTPNIESANKSMAALTPVTSAQVGTIIGGAKAKGKLFLHIFDSSSVLTYFFLSSVSELSQQNKDTTFVVISVDENPSNVALFLINRTFPFPIYSLTENTNALSGVLRTYYQIPFKGKGTYTYVYSGTLGREMNMGPGFREKVDKALKIGLNEM